MYNLRSVGADPEVFLKSRATGAFVTAQGVIPGDKRHPYCPDYTRYREAMQLDGVAAEFNTDPANTKVKFINSVARIYGLVKERASNRGLDTVAVPVADFEPTYFSTLSEESRMLGCNPDLDAWAQDYNEVPDASGCYRTGSGHVHVSWGEGRFDIDTPEHFEECCKIVKELDYYLGLPSMLWDPDNRRRSLYGRAGAFRMKPYGLEYRVMSNVWLNNVSHIEYIYDAIAYCFKQMDRGILMYDKFSDLARIIINDNHTDWVKRHGNILERELPIV